MHLFYRINATNWKVCGNSQDLHKYFCIIYAVEPDISKAQTIFKILCNKNRIEVILRLAKKDRCVGELADCINVNSSKVSKQITYLKRLGYVSGHKSGLRTYYHLENKSLPGLIKYVENSGLFRNLSS